MSRTLLAVLGATAFFGAGLAAGTTMAQHSAPGEEARTPVRQAETPATPLPTRSGAVAEATQILYAFDLRTVLDPEAFARVVHRVAAPGRRDEIAALFGDGIDEVRAMFAGAPRIARAAPIGFRLLDFDGSRASVAIWNVAIGGGPLITPTAQWRTIVLDLRFARGRWKAMGGRTVSGPSPGTPLRELAERANDFKEFGSHVP